MRLIDADFQAGFITEYILKRKGTFLDILEKGDNDFLFALMMDYFKEQPEFEQQPTVERPKGKWDEEELSLPLSDSTRTAYRCSNCTLHFDSPTKYCPNCGSFNKADIKGEEE